MFKELPKYHSLDHIVSTPPANKIIVTVNSGSLIGSLNFHTFTCAGSNAV